MSSKIFFFHNPKAGGTSLMRVLESRVPAEKRCPLIENTKVEHDELAGDLSRFRGYDLYAGHYGYDIFAAVNDGHDCLTNFRHPAARLLSLYNFFRFVVDLTDEALGMERFYAVRFAKSISFEEFISSDDPRVEVYVRNWHFRQLANSCWSPEITKPLDDVCRFIEAMLCYYVCEYPKMSIRWMRSALNWDLDRLPREQVTGDQGGRATSLWSIDQRFRGFNQDYPGVRDLLQNFAGHGRSSAEQAEALFAAMNRARNREPIGRLHREELHDR